MRLHKLAVALAALSFAGVAAAAGDTNGSMANPSSHDKMTTQQTSPQSTQQNESANGSMNSMPSSAPQGSQSGDEHNPTTVRSAQQALKEKGFDVGTVDGQMGPNTESALRNFQQSKNLPQTGNLDQQTLAALGVNGSEAGAASTESSSQGPSSSNRSPSAGQGSSQPGAMPSQGTSTQNNAYK